MLSSKYLVGCSIGNGKLKLNAFDDALLKSGVGNYNLLKVSSILPCHCHQRDHIDLPEGSTINTAYASITSKETGKIISAGIGIAIPCNESKVGVIMESSGEVCKTETERKLKKMLVESMKLRNVLDYKIILHSVECTVKDGYSCAFSCVAMWK